MCEVTFARENRRSGQTRQIGSQAAGVAPHRFVEARNGLRCAGLTACAPRFDRKKVADHFGKEQFNAMTYMGKISNGAIVLPPDVHLPEGMVVEIKPIHSDAGEFTDTPEQIAQRVKLTVAHDRAATLKSLRGAGRKYLKPGQDPIAELIAEREREDGPR